MSTPPQQYGFQQIGENRFIRPGDPDRIVFAMDNTGTPYPVEGDPHQPPPPGPNGPIQYGDLYGNQPPAPKKKSKGILVGVLIAVAAIIVMIIVVSIGNPDTLKTAVAPATHHSAPAASTKPKAKPSHAAPAPKPKPGYTYGQKQAIAAAKSYLDYSGFSKKGLIGQLKYDKYPTADAKFAVNHITVNWNHQAVRVANDYLDYSSFSEKGLVEQLEYDKFTTAQATYGAHYAFTHR